MRLRLLPPPLTFVAPASTVPVCLQSTYVYFFVFMCRRGVWAGLLCGAALRRPLRPPREGQGGLARPADWLPAPADCAPPSAGVAESAAVCRWP